MEHLFRSQTDNPISILIFALTLLKTERNFVHSVGNLSPKSVVS